MRPVLSIGVLLVFCVAGSVAASPMVFTDDLIGDWSGDPICEIYGIGSRIEEGKLFFEIRTDTPQAGFFGYDGRAHTHFSPGDLVIAVNTDNPFSPGVALHGIALTSHGNIVQQAYAGETWDNVSEGSLYLNAEFATGTFERYQQYMAGRGVLVDPDDQDGDDRLNSYFSLIKTGSEVLGQSDATYAAADPGDLWDYVISGWVEMEAIGLLPGMDYALFFSLECGNDAALHTHTYFDPGGPEDPGPAIPEPGVHGLILAGLGLLYRRRT
jgi:hypothetical protein